VDQSSVEDENTAAIDIVLIRINPKHRIRIALASAAAAMGFLQGGPGSGLYRSRR